MSHVVCVAVTVVVAVGGDQLPQTTRAENHRAKTNIFHICNAHHDISQTFGVWRVLNIFVSYVAVVELRTTTRTPLQEFGKSFRDTLIVVVLSP